MIVVQPEVFISMEPYSPVKYYTYECTYWIADRLMGAEQRYTWAAPTPIPCGCLDSVVAASTDAMGGE